MPLTHAFLVTTLVISHRNHARFTSKGGSVTFFMDKDDHEGSFLIPQLLLKSNPAPFAPSVLEIFQEPHKVKTKNVIFKGSAPFFILKLNFFTFGYFIC